MLRSFLIITLRILWRNKVTSFINIFSLSIGITAFILIMLYVHHEFSYDKFNENYDRIYRLEAMDYGTLPPAIGDYVMDKVPEVEIIARISRVTNRYLGLITEDNPADLNEIRRTLPMLTVPFSMFSPCPLSMVIPDLPLQILLQSY